MKLLKEAIASNETEKIIDNISELFKQYNIYADIWSTGKDSFSVYISWGDWKHDHLAAKQLISRVLNDIDYSVETNVTDKDGSDTYSAVHNVTIYPPKANLDALEENKKATSLIGKFEEDLITESLGRYADTDAQEETANKIETEAKKLGIRLRYGTKVGKYPQSLILDYHYQDGAVRVRANGSCEINGEDLGSYKDEYVNPSSRDIRNLLTTLKEITEDTHLINSHKQKSRDMVNEALENTVTEEEIDAILDKLYWDNGDGTVEFESINRDKIKFYISGDHSHTHAAFRSLFKKEANKLGYDVKLLSNREIGHSDGDWYKSIETFKLTRLKPTKLNLDEINKKLDDLAKQSKEAFNEYSKTFDGDSDAYKKLQKINKEYAKLYSYKINKENNMVEDFLQEGRADIYNQLEDEYITALSRAEEKGIVTFTVDKDGEQEDEFDSFDAAVEYAKEIGKDKIYVSSFGECYGAYCDGEYEEYDEHILDLNRSIVENFKPIFYKDYTIEYDDEKTNSYIILNNQGDDATAGHMFKSITAAKRAIDSGDLAYPNEESLEEDVDTMPSMEHTLYVLHNIIDWERDYSPKDLSDVRDVAAACHTYDPDYSTRDFLEAIEYYDLFDDEGNVISELNEKALKESVITVYNGTDDNNLDYKNIDFTKSKELGIHCGSEKAASSKGSIVNKLSIDTSNCYKMDTDFRDIWPKPTLLQYMDFLTAEEVAEAKAKMREVSGDYDKYEKYSTILRNLFLKHGYKCISYPNAVEDPGHTSYIILDDSIIIDESIKEDLEYDYDDAKSWEGIFGIADEQKTANSFQQPVIGKDKTYLPKLSVEEVRELAEQHYNEGGDAIIECWTDEDILMWIEEHGTKEELLQLFRTLHDRYIDMKGSGEYCDIEADAKKIEDEDNIEADYDEEDFGPGNPWDAPGMSIKDFLR